MAGHSGVQGGYEAVVAGASKEAADTEVALTCGARRCTRRVARTRGDGGWCEQGGGGHGRSTPLYKAGVCGCNASEDGCKAAGGWCEQGGGVDVRGHAAVREASVYGYEAVVMAGRAAIREASVYGCKQEQGALLLINHKP